MEDVVDTRTTWEIHCSLFDEATFELVGVSIDEKVDQMEYKWTAINVSNRVSGHRCHLGGRELVLFLC